MIYTQTIKIDEKIFLFEQIMLLFDDNGIALKITWDYDKRLISKLEKQYTIREFTGKSRIIKSLKAFFNGDYESTNYSLSFESELFHILNKPTAFQKAVWQEAMKIPYGEKVSYSELAKNLGNENLSRAIGNALGKNPLPILVPCHRVIGKNSLGGFTSPKGLKHKKAILDFEKFSLKKHNKTHID